jgi:HEAT repeat protein
MRRTGWVLVWAWGVSAPAHAAEPLPLETALPRLLAEGHDAEALRLVRQAALAAPDPALGLLARAWLGRALTRPPLVVAAAVGLAGAGDGSVGLILEAALRRGDRPSLVGPALAHIKRPLCPVVSRALARGWEARAAAIEALRAAEVVEPACVGALLDIARDEASPAGQRAQAVAALGAGAAHLGDDPDRSGEDAAAAEESRAVSLARIQDLIGRLARRGPTLVRVAALGAQGRGLGPVVNGRSTLLALFPLLRDRDVEVRAAAGATLVEIGGEEMLPQLHALFREDDLRPYQAAAAELARLDGQRSAALLARMLRREEPEIQLLAAAALARRWDEPARAALAPLAASADPELRLYAAATLSAEERIAVARAAGPAGTAAYRALVAGPGRDAAGVWLLLAFEQLGPGEQVDSLGLWLASERDALSARGRL